MYEHTWNTDPGGWPGVIAYDSGGRLRFANPTARALFDGGELPAGVVPAALREPVAAAFAALDGDERACRLIVHAAPGKALRAEAFMPDADGAVVVILVADGATALDEDLYAATRFRGLSTLYAGAAHDLRGPLNNMVVNLELLKHGLLAQPGGAAEHLPWLEAAQREIHRLNGQLQVMLDLTASDADDEAPVDMVEVLAELARLLRATAKLKRVQFEWTLPELRLFVRGRRDRLRQLLLNIVLNGFEAMPDGGVLRATLRHDARTVVTEFCNDGEPLPAALRAQLFRGRVTTKPAASGIGLYVAQRLAEQAGGSVSLHENGAGVCFSVALPRARDDDEDRRG